MTTKSWLRSVSTGLALVLTSGCGKTLSLEEFSAQVREARACAEGDTCVLAGGGTCTCSSPVNISRAEAINEAVKNVDCEGSMVDCVAYRNNARCEAGTCVADTF